MPSYVVASVDEIPPGKRKLVDANGRAIVVFNLDGEFYALTNRCPHRGGSLAHGIQTGVPNVHARIMEVTTGGYDTHSDQGGVQQDGRHWQLLSELGDSLKLFYNDCVEMGVADKIVIMVWSEFGRRVPQNDGGTDHGTQYPVFVIGGSVTGGVYGNHPNIDDLALSDDGNTVYSQAAADSFRSTDMRDIYGTIAAGKPYRPLPPTVATFEDGYRANRIVEAILESANNGGVWTEVGNS